MRLLAVVALAIGLCGCAPTSLVPAQQDPTELRKAPEIRKVDCSRQFDENDAGFQTCVDDGGEAPSGE